MKLSIDISKLGTLSENTIQIIEESESIESLFRSFSSYLSKSYDEICLLFDSAKDVDCMLPDYSVSRTAKNVDLFDLYIWSIVAKDYFSKKRHGIDKQLLLTVLGRFTLAFIGSDSLCFSEIFKSMTQNIIHSLFDCDWSFDESTYLKLSFMNLFYLNGIQKITDLDEILLEEDKVAFEDNKLVFEKFQESVDCFLSYVNNTTSIESLDPQYLYVIIFKKRFGFICCKRISVISKNGYTFEMDAYSPCFKHLSKRRIVNSSKAIVVLKGENRRSNEYQPPERVWCYNWSKMQFE